MRPSRRQAEYRTRPTQIRLEGDSADIFSLLSNAVSAVRLAKSAADKISNADMQMQLADLMSLLADLKLECANLSMVNSDLKKRLQEERDANQNPPELDGDVYLFGEDFSPCCIRCWDTARKKVLLKEYIAAFQMNFQDGKPLCCPTCKTEHFGGEDDD